MASKMLQRLPMFAVIVAIPVVGHAQETAILGVVTDASGAVMPGVTVTVTHEASGNVVSAVTDARGEYRVPLRAGTIRISAELSGFNTLNRTMELLVGQTATLNLQMAPATLQETITVTAISPLVDTMQSQVGGNIDPKQIAELPVNGRNFLDLTLTAPGSRANSVDDTPFGGSTGFGSFQLNVDGQQITQNCCAGAGGQPRFSKDAIEEFQFISNRFDAAQGRSAGIQINVITKSGTNTPS